MPKFAAILGAIALCAAAATAATGEPTPQLPTEAIKKPLPGPLRPLACMVDPAIGAITLTKGKAAGSVQVTVEVRNMGSSAWQSGANQQNVSVSVKNGNTGNVVSRSQALPGRAAANSRMGMMTTPMIANAFDTFEFGGSVEASISYDPDIAIDGNNCNDDRNSANNRKTVSFEQVQAFLAGSAPTRSF
ncbi:hypothetical protein [Sphingorhabdus sp.]|uniref:hypothetical protein n=1 Tax=Sphingorhabdus sp. TaxID=1902408 RepID=UPI0032B7D5BA